MKAKKTLKELQKWLQVNLDLSESIMLDADEADDEEEKNKQLHYSAMLRYTLMKIEWLKNE